VTGTPGQQASPGSQPEEENALMPHEADFTPDAAGLREALERLIEAKSRPGRRTSTRPNHCS